MAGFCSGSQMAPATGLRRPCSPLSPNFSFMTAMCVALDPLTGKASIVGAGHPPLLVTRPNGTTESIASIAPPLGLIEQPEFTETAIDLEPGDAFLLYTDGVFRWT